MIDIVALCNSGPTEPMVHVIVLASRGDHQPWAISRFGGSCVTMAQRFLDQFEVVTPTFAYLPSDSDSSASFHLDDPTLTNLAEACSAGDVAVILDHVDFAVESNRGG